MIIECMIGTVSYSDIPQDPLEELFDNIKWKKINSKQGLDGITDPFLDEDEKGKI